jgi:hypothetical protein
MTNYTEQISKRELVFFNPSGSSLRLRVVNLDLIVQENALSECRLTFRVTSDLYQQIEAESLFNLNPELRGALNAASFQSEAAFKIEATLQPQLLLQLAEHAADTETVISYLIACSKEISDALLEKPMPNAVNNSTQTHPASNPLLSSESWFALDVRQHQESGEIGYRTFWSYLNPVDLTPDASANGQFPESMEQFLKDRNEANLAMAGQAIAEVLEEISNDLKNLDETEFLKQTETAISDFFSEVTNALKNRVEPTQSISKTKANSKGKIYQAMLNFFSEEDWEFTKLQGKLILRLAFHGKNGQWSCFALANEDQQRFLFYSICPFDIPPLNRSAITEFLTRANYGMEIGNFEFDVDSGEIRFKTSLDVSGDRITPILIKQLVYTNVLTTDQYLPGIHAVLNETTPMDAIRAIEQPDLNVPPNAPSSEG